MLPAKTISMPTSVQLHDKTFVPFLDEQVIAERVAELGAKITENYVEKELLVIGVLNGAYLFMADLVRHVQQPCQHVFVQYSSYEGMKSTGKLTAKLPLPHSLEGKHVLLVEDIVDTGHTIKALSEEVKAKGAASVEIATLLLKPEALEEDVEINYCGFSIENRFVVGYGMDYDELGRELPAVYVLQE